MTFWAWIPILTKQIQYEFFITKMKYDGLVDVSESDKETIRYILKSEDFDCYRRQDSEDENQKTFKAILCVKDYKIKHVFMYDSEGKIKTLAHCIIYDNGLVKINLDSNTAQISDKIQPKVAKRIYILIRDVYHSHTHHGKYDDLHLLPVLSDNKEFAIEKLLNQYDKKIIIYHKSIKIDVKNHTDFNAAIKLITSAKGEMNYALHFLTLMKDDVDDFESYKSSFLINIQSISILADELELKHNNSVSEYNSNISNILNILTFIIIFGAIPVTLESVYNLLNTPGLSEIIVYNINFINNIKLTITLPILVTIFYLISFMYVVYKFKYWLSVHIKNLKIIRFVKKYIVKIIKI